jgi:hypothetical protein
MVMNLNDLQEAWNREEGGENELRLNLAGLKEAHQPIDAIRKNMKNELYLQLAVIALLAYAPFYYGISGKLLMAYFTLYGLLVTVSGYYFYRFTRFFGKLHNYNANAKDSLYELYYEIRLHCEMYKSLTYLLIPFLLVIGGIIGYTKKTKQLPEEPLFTGDLDWVILSVLSIFFTLMIIAATNWWVNHFYGKHAKSIRKILDELKE